MEDQLPSAPKMTQATDLILESLLDAILVVDGHGYIIYANRSAQNLLELPYHKLIGAPFGYPSGPGQVQEIDLLKGDKIVTVQMLATPIQWDGKSASLLSLRDITELKKANEELLSQKKQLERINEENAQFAFMASHDLTAPIRKIQFFADKLLHGDWTKPLEKMHLEKIQKSADRMQLLIEGIASLSRVSHVKQEFEPIDLNKVVEDVCHDLEFVIKENQARIECLELPCIEAVPLEMYLLFSNLISNSMKYRRKEVRPFIELKSFKSREGWIQIDCNDNGIGFSNEYAHSLFRPFHRLNPVEYDGIGMGLALCKKIVDIHNGEIYARGKEGVGAIFSIILPIKQF